MLCRRKNCNNDIPRPTPRNSPNGYCSYECQKIAKAEVNDLETEEVEVPSKCPSSSERKCTMKKPTRPDTDLIESEYSDTDCDSFGDLYVCNDCGSHDIGTKDNQEAYCRSCASLNVIIE